MGRLWIGVAALLLPSALWAQSEAPAVEPVTAAESDELQVVAIEGAAGPETGDAQRTELNLLGEVDADSGEGRRNENVRLTLINNNVLKELNTRLGTTATIIEQFDPQREYFGREFGGAPSSLVHVGRASTAGVHGEVFWSHSNSALSARSFFQVGGVQPARTNDYGFRVSTGIGEKTALTVNGSQRKLRGQVNGNVLVPGADERTPVTTDPATRTIVESILSAYPTDLPNRTDINPRALNTNSPQNIDNDRADATLDHAFSEKDAVVARYAVTLQQVEAFQLVGGQNPDTTTKNHDARLTWTRTWSPTTVSDLSMGYRRVGSLLVPEETSLGPFYLFGRLMDSIGPNSSIPIDRASNTFRYAGRLRKSAGRHELSVGFDLFRRQVNGAESNNHRGTFSFRNDFGRNIAQNLLLGTASSYNVAIGDPHRGFRDWRSLLFLGDKWNVSSKLSLNMGVRYEPVTLPREVNGLLTLPYDADSNNVAGSFGFAYRAHDRWGVFRGAYGVHYGEIFQATYMQTRFNAPGVLSINIAAPKLVDPLQDLTPDQLDPSRARTTFFRLDPELATPYSHQYNFTWEMEPRDGWTVELGYVGSRSHKLLQTWYLNRAEQVEGIDTVSRTVNLRRPDPRFFDIRHTVNASRGYYDAGKATLRIPSWGGLNLEASYWYSKAIDLGSNYTNTSTGRDGRNARSPAQDDVHGRMRGLSDFDQTHAAVWNVVYETPGLSKAPRSLRALLGRWQVSSVILAKSGPPFGVRTADAPGLGNVDGAGSDRPNIDDPSILGRSVDDPDSAPRQLPRSAFSSAGLDQAAGNLGANTFRKDAIFNVNFALSRQFSIGGDTTVLFRVESLNFLNHPQFAEPGFDLSGENFGQITNTLNDGRAFRFTLRFGW